MYFSRFDLGTIAPWADSRRDLWGVTLSPEEMRSSPKVVELLANIAIHQDGDGGWETYYSQDFSPGFVTNMVRIPYIGPKAFRMAVCMQRNIPFELRSNEEGGKLVCDILRVCHVLKDDFFQLGSPLLQFHPAWDKYPAMMLIVVRTSYQVSILVGKNQRHREILESYLQGFCGEGINLMLGIEVSFSGCLSRIEERMKNEFGQCIWPQSLIDAEHRRKAQLR